jgi:hypothetical protein
MRHALYGYVIQLGSYSAIDYLLGSIFQSPVIDRFILSDPRNRLSLDQKRQPSMQHHIDIDILSSNYHHSEIREPYTPALSQHQGQGDAQHDSHDNSTTPALDRRRGSPRDRPQRVSVRHPVWVVFGGEFERGDGQYHRDR